MATYGAIKDFGEKLRRSNCTHLSLSDLTSMVRNQFNIHHSVTIRHYLKTMEESGYIKGVLVDGAVRFEIVREGGEKRDNIDTHRANTSK
jgi:Fe2+ or Zn2+ uptake regulation protein